jgi:hypothetical protein
MKLPFNYCKPLPFINIPYVVSGQLHRLCWALRNSKEERIDLHAEDREQEEADDGVEEGSVQLTFWFSELGLVKVSFYCH